MSEQALFRNILHRSFRLVIERPSLWLLGLLASGTAGMGVAEFVYSFVGTVRSSEVQEGGVTLIGSTADALYTWLLPPYTNLYLPLMGILLLVITVVLFLMTVISFGALIRGSVEKKTQSLPLLWHHGTSHVLHLSGVVLLRHLAIALLLAGSVYATIFIGEVGGVFAEGLQVVLWVISAFLVAGVSFLSIYAATSMSLEGFKMKQAYERAWHTFRRHMAVSIEMALALFLVELASLVLVAGIVVLVAIPVYFTWVIGLVAGTMALLKYGLVVALLLLFIVGFFVAAWFTVFQVSAWSALYLKTRDGVIKSRLLTFFGIHK